MFPFGGAEVGGVIWCGRFHIVEDMVGPAFILSAKICGPLSLFIRLLLRYLWGSQFFGHAAYSLHSPFLLFIFISNFFNIFKNDTIVCIQKNKNKGLCFKNKCRTLPNYL